MTYLGKERNHERAADRDKDKTKESEIADLMAEERSRGRRGRTDVKPERERQRLRRDFERLLESGDEREFIAALRSAGIPETSPEFLKALKVWRDLKKK